MADLTTTNPYNILPFGFPHSTKIFFDFGMCGGYSREWAAKILETVWTIWVNDGESQISTWRLTLDRPFGSVANYGVVRLFPWSLNPLHGAVGLSNQNSWPGVPNVSQLERMLAVTYRDGSIEAAIEAGQSAAHEIGHCCGLVHVTGPENNVMLKGGALTYRSTTPEQRSQVRARGASWQTLFIQ
jgi:hypothetical protein